MKLVHRSNIMSINDGGIFTQEELEQRALINKTRFDIIKERTKDGPPATSGDIRVLNEVMTSADKMIVDTANTRIRQGEAAKTGAAADLVVELLRESRANRPSYTGEGYSPEVSEEIIDVELVDGETDINPLALVAEEFITPQFDASKTDS